MLPGYLTVSTQPTPPSVPGPSYRLPGSSPRPPVSSPTTPWWRPPSWVWCWGRRPWAPVLQRCRWTLSCSAECESAGVPQVVGVRKIIVHPSYSSTSTNPTANLALMMLASPEGGSYSALCLPAQDGQVTGSVVLVGWRISPVLGSLEQTLVSLNTDIVAQSDCGVSSDLLCTGQDTRWDRKAYW